jgi:hypothetical protein
MKLNIYPYLKSIEASNPINASRFSDLLHSIHIKLSDLGDASFISIGKHSFQVTNHDLFNQLVSKYSPSQSRIHAAKQGNSHRHATHTSYLIAKEGSLDKRVLAIACHDEIDMPELKFYPPDMPVILIENSECFTFSADFLQSMELDHINCSSLIILSSGNAITHRQSVRFLNHFNCIYYCPDYDLAGIEIFETLQKTLGKKIVFSAPSNLCEFIAYSKKPTNPKQLLTAIDKSKKLGLEVVSEFLTNSLGFLEQEIFLGEK